MLNRTHSAFLPALFLLAVSAVPLAAQQLEIVEASYGAGNYQMNVAPKLRGLMQNNVLDFSVDPGLLGGDPAPGSAKRLRVVYRYGGRQAEMSAGDFERVRIPALSGGAVSPVTPTPVTPAPAAAGGFSLGDLWGGGNASLRIVSARYGDATRGSDVRDRLQNLVRNDALSLKIDNAAMGGDPAVARDKTLDVVYEYRGTSFQTAVKEGATLTLPDSNARAVSTQAPMAAPVAATVAGSQQGIRIVTARYGGDNRFNDVRDRLQSLAGSGATVSMKVENGALGGDPAVGKDKWLEVAYEWNGSTYATRAKEGQTLSLPDPQAMLVSDSVTQPAAAPAGRGADSGGGRNAGRRPAGGPIVTPSGGREIIPIGRTGGLRIFYARYGAPGQEIDVREQLRPLLQPEALNITVGVDAMGGDPAPGVLKTITVIYEMRGRTFEKSATDGQTLILP